MGRRAEGGKGRGDEDLGVDFGSPRQCVSISHGPCPVLGTYLDMLLPGRASLTLIFTNSYGFSSGSARPLL